MITLSAGKPDITDLMEDEDDLIPPPMSLSLPELFSEHHQVVEVMREAVSSTELLHERAMERFYRAIAAEEASELAKRKTQVEKQTGDLAQTEAENAQLALRRRLSNSGVTTQNLIASWQAKKNRRRSSEGQTDQSHKKMKLLLPALLSDVEARSDPNLPSETTMLNPWTKSNDEDSVERLRRWHETNLPLLEEVQPEKSIPTTTNDEETTATTVPTKVNGVATQSTALTKMKEDERETYSVETSEESSEEISSADSEDLKSLKSRILSRSIIDEEDTYHPRGRPIPHVEPEIPQIPYERIPTLDILTPADIRVASPVSPSNVVPKSILKKPKEESSPQDDSNKSIPPEKPVRKMLPQQYQQEEDVEDMDMENNQEAPVDLPKMSEVLKTPTMSESDTDSIVSAAEAARSRRIMSRMRSMTSEEEAAEAEARMAVVNQYTEIVREYSSHSKGLDSAASSRRSSFSEDQDQKHRVQEKLAPKPTKKQEQDDTSKSNAKIKNEADKQKRGNQTPSSRKGNADSRGATPARDTMKEKRASKPSSRDQSPAARRRDLPAERARGSSSRSSSKTRNRTPSRDRSKRSMSRNDSGESQVVEKSLEQGTRRSKVPSRPSSRSSSRSNSRERYGATVPVESKVEKLQKALESNKYRAARKGSAQENAEEERTPDGQQLVLEAKEKVRSTVSYMTDLTLLMAAMYVYLFKRETLAIPFIALLLYRRVQEVVHSWLPRRWWWSTKKH